MINRYMVGGLRMVHPEEGGKRSWFRKKKGGLTVKSRIVL